MKTKAKWIVRIINLLIIVLVVILGVALYRYVRLHHYNEENKRINEKVIEEVITPIDKEQKEEKEQEETTEFTVDFNKLKSINEDVVGWIFIPNTKINYPILWKNDNKYYLNHDINKKYNILGSIFMNTYNHKDFSDANTILFGHNNHKDNLMFTDLKEIYDGNIKTPIDIHIYTEMGQYVYRVYSIYLADPNDEKPLNVNTKFFSKSERDLDYDAVEGEQTLTLSTCYKDSSLRIIVHASRIM